MILVVLGVVGALFGADAKWERPAPRERYEEYLIVPLRIHLLRSERYPELNCALADEDVTRIVGKINGIWAQAGIQFYLESLRREPAEEAHVLDEPQPGGRGALKLRPEASLAEGMFHVYYVHRLPFNGVYYQRDAIFVQDTASLRAVEGGIDEPLPRVTAHELGHALSLPHRQDRTNLLASGTTGVLLNADEITRTRAAARALSWITSPAAALARADEVKGTIGRAILRCLVEIPVPSALRETAADSLKHLEKSD